uniref:hydroxymethylbilane synthase n=1 Tax=Lutzomyia longipalpis TaxID=7200 RepID=A0A1B0CP35_LUTLO
MGWRLVRCWSEKIPEMHSCSMRSIVGRHLNPPGGLYHWYIIPPAGSTASPVLPSAHSLRYPGESQYASGKTRCGQFKFAGIILAHAGLVRMGWEKRISQVLKCDELLYAVGQGALAVECRADAEEILRMLQKLCCRITEGRILAERSFLRTLGGGCSAPVAVSSSLKRARDQDGHKLTLRGAVWSLDGKTEIRDEVSCEVPFEVDATEVDGVPPKKVKVTEVPARRSPDIIDDSKATGGEAQNLDIGALINLHGDAFKRCPYSKQQQPHERCPLSIPIGQDVMGVCPFFGTTEKVNLAEEFGPEHKEATAGVSKCPFSGTKITPEAPPIEKCPFLANQVKLIDCDAEHGQVQHNGDSVVAPQTNIPLFCGLFRHTTVPQDFLAKSEALGKQLANALIARGAMEVMSKAQDEIRGKV